MRNNNIVLLSMRTGAFVFFIITICFLCVFNSVVVSLPLMVLADEFLLLLAFGIVCTLMVRQIVFYQKIEKIYVFLTLYIFYQIINYFISPFDLKIEMVLAQSIINIKVFIVALGVLLVWNNSVIYRKTVKYILYLFVGLFFIGFMMNMFLQEAWNVFLAPDERVSYRYGFIRPIGWFGHYAPNAYFLVLTLTTLYLLYAKKLVLQPRLFLRKFFIFSIVDFLLTFPLTVRKGMLIVVPFGLIAFSMLKGKVKIVSVVVVLVVLLVFLFLIKDMGIMQDTLSNLRNVTTDEDNTYIRGLMIFYGFSLFSEFFPFGVGNATFGTVLSQYNTLDVYAYVGLDLDRIYYNTGRLGGVYDSGLFSMLAENGFIGMVLMMMFIYYFFKFNRKRLDSYNYIVFKIITWFTLLLSITEPVWQNGMYTVFYVINLLFIYTKNDLYKVNGRWRLFEDDNKV